MRSACFQAHIFWTRKLKENFQYITKIIILVHTHTHTHIYIYIYIYIYLSSSSSSSCHAASRDFPESLSLPLSLSLSPFFPIIYRPRRFYLSLPPTRQDSIQGQWPEGRLKVGISGGECRARAEERALLVIDPLWVIQTTSCVRAELL